MVAASASTSRDPRAAERSAQLPQRSRRSLTIGTLTVTLLAYAALAWGYVTLTPPWQNPDEPAHYNYVAFVAHTGGLPELKPGDWDSALLQRLKTGTFQSGDSTSSIRYESWQPPLFYLLATPVFRIGPSDERSTLVRLRALDAVFGALTLLVTYAVARQVLPGELVLAAPLTMVGIPMFTAVSAALSADPLANMLSAAIVWQLARRLNRPITNERPWAIGTGALLGFGMLTKLAMAIFVPIALVVIAKRATRTISEAAIALVTAAILVAPWLLHQVTTYGWTDPLALARHSAVVGDQPRFPGLTPDYLGQFLTVTFHSFWAQFGWMAIVAQDRLYWIWGVVGLVAFVGLIVRPLPVTSQPVWRLLIGTTAAAFVAYVGYNLTFEQFQGRYLFTALAPIAIALVLGWAAWLPARVRPWGAPVVAVALVGLNVFTLVRVLVPGFAPPS